jgi:hypothetical protein
MPFFKRKQERSVRLEELEAHVQKIRKLAAEDPNPAGALQSFLIEDGYWERQEVALQAQEQPAPEKTPPAIGKPPPPKTPPAAAPEAGMVTAASLDSPPRTEDEAMLEAELQRYLAKIAEETEPDEDLPSYGFEAR